jgi:hypothetical protein
MRFPVKGCCFFFAFLLLLPFVASAGDIQINGICVVGTCPPPSGTSDALQFNQSIGLTTGSYSLTFPDTDQYSIAWSYSASYTAAGTELSINPVATYIGASPSVGNDDIAFDFFQNFYDNSSGSWDGSYTESVPLNIAGNVGAGSTASGQLFYDSQPLPLVGPFGPGSYFGQYTESLTGLNDPTLAAEYQFTFDFVAGTQNGASASSVPEPYEALPLGLALGCVAWNRRAARRRASYNR